MKGEDRAEFERGGSSYGIALVANTPSFRYT